MSYELADLGWHETDNRKADRANKVVLEAHDGHIYVVTIDPNTAAAKAINAANGDGSGTDRLRIWRISPSTGAIAQIVNTAIGAIDYPANTLSADCYPDGSIGVVYRRSTGEVQFRKVTVGTWAVSAAETVGSPGAGKKMFSADVTVTTGAIPIVGWMIEDETNPKLTVVVKARRASDGAWPTSMPTLTILGNNAPQDAMSNFAIQAINGGSATTRPVVIAVDSSQKTGSDQGCRVYSFVVNESSAAVANLTHRATILAGNQTNTLSVYPRRTYLFKGVANEVILARQEVADKKTMLVTRFTFDSNVWAQPMANQTAVVGPATVVGARMACAYSTDRVTFYYVREIGGLYMPFTYIAKIDRATNSTRFSGPYEWDNRENTSAHRMYPMGGTGYHAGLSTRPKMAIISRGTNGAHSIRWMSSVVPPAPTSVTPAGGALMNGTPQLGLRFRLGRAFGQARYKAEWQFASDAAFTANVRTYTQGDEKFAQVDNTAATNAYVAFADTLPSDLALTSGTWFVRARMIDEYGVTSAWSAASSTSFSHPPAAKDLSPSAGQTLPDSAVTFSWGFTDPLPTDSQTAFQIIVERNDTGAVVYDSGKIDTVSTTHLTQIGAQYASVLLQWKIRLWDSDNTAGDYSGVSTFMVAGPPTVAIVAPTPASVVGTGTPAVSFVVTIDSGRAVTAYQVTITQAGKVVRRSGVVPGNWVTGTQITWRSPMPMLPDGNYEVNVSVNDASGMRGTAGPVAFSVDVVEPAAPTGLTLGTSHYNTENEGYVEVYWDDTQRDADFEAWVVYRKDDMLGYGTTVVDEGEWEEIDQVTETQVIYEYRDFYAPSGYKVSYKIAQLVNRNGDRAISQVNTIRSVYPRSDGYWIIEPQDPDTGQRFAFRLENVTSDSYSPEYEESEYVILGRGRKVDRGDYLGVKGSLTAQIRNTADSTARQKKKQLEEARGVESEVYIRNPFGDVIPVNIGNLSISRIAGVGKDEFVDVDIPYAEVGE